MEELNRVLRDFRSRPVCFGTRCMASLRTRRVPLRRAFSTRSLVLPSHALICFIARDNSPAGIFTVNVAIAHTPGS